MNQTSTSTSDPSHFAIQVVPGGDQHFIGKRRAIKRLMKRGVRVVVPVNTDLIICVNALDTFLTYGPVGGGDNTIYELIEWAFFNTDAFGIHIAQGDDMNMPVLTLPDKKTANAAMAWLNAKGAGA